MDSVFNKIKDTFEDLGDDIVNFGENVGTSIYDESKDVGNIVIGGLKDAQIDDNLNMALNKVKNELVNIGQKVKKTGEEGIDILGDIPKLILKVIVFIVDILKAFQDVLKKIPHLGGALLILNSRLMKMFNIFLLLLPAIIIFYLFAWALKRLEEEAEEN